MALKENKIYWKISLDNPEPAVDDFYVKDEIIINDKNLIKSVERLRELITSYCVVSEKDKDASKGIFDEIFEIITSIEKVQYMEFAAFWKVFDISFSAFKNLPNKKAVLKELLRRYCERRRKLYDNLGYTNVTVQALYDSGASRKKGVSGIEKLVKLFSRTFSSLKHVKDISELEKSETAYFLPDKGDKKLFRDFCRMNGVSYRFGRQHQGKEPDMVLKARNNFFIVEAKHIKEGGGAQDKQLVETIEFIKFSESSGKIHYLSFLDGIYFNNFIYSEDDGKNKIDRQIKDIEEFLKKNINNFFVNTTGLKAVLEDLKR